MSSGRSGRWCAPLHSTDPSKSCSPTLVCRFPLDIKIPMLSIVTHCILTRSTLYQSITLRTAGVIIRERTRAVGE